MITDYDRMHFDQNHLLRRNVRDNGWEVINKHTGEVVSPTYSDPQGAIYFVIKLLQEEMGEAMERVIAE